MFDSIVTAWEWLISDGQHLLAVSIGMIVSWGLTQAIKKHWTLNRGITRGIAFLVGSLAAFLSMPGREWFELWLAVAAGIAAPTIYKIFVVVLRKARPSWAEALSSDERRT